MSTTEVNSSKLRKMDRRASKFQTSKALMFVSEREPDKIGMAIECIKSSSPQRHLTQKPSPKKVQTPLSPVSPNIHRNDLIPQDFLKFYNSLVEYDQIKSKLRDMTKQLKCGAMKNKLHKRKRNYLKMHPKVLFQNRHEKCKIRVKSTWIPEIKSYPCQRKPLVPLSGSDSFSSIQKVSLLSSPKDFYTSIRKKLNSSMDYNKRAEKCLSMPGSPEKDLLSCDGRNHTSQASIRYVKTKSSTMGSTVANFSTSTQKFITKDSEKSTKARQKGRKLPALRLKGRQYRRSQKRKIQLTSVYV
ncbi:unnamed protein product [Moneuplotes crassus]|uniref:Uncharacterized protein n=1 Tax=Euplotes crassus TaxID=5936 RepID=A0AAD1UHJ8_EUPCR|nr:unnamed protein product [Moneuplotes crassus]